jgi:hypothetical protein
MNSFKINNLFNKFKKTKKQVKFRLRESFYLNVSVKIRPFSISLSKVRKNNLNAKKIFFNFVASIVRKRSQGPIFIGTA